MNPFANKGYWEDPKTGELHPPSRKPITPKSTSVNKEPLPATGPERKSNPCHQSEPITARKSTDEEKLNKTEKAFLEYLRVTQSFAGHDLGISWIGIQNMTLKLGHDLRFTPDFVIVDDVGIKAFDVKGFQRDDALVKTKTAARMFPWIHFSIVKKTGWGWSFKWIKP